jgi:hypothetical protein
VRFIDFVQSRGPDPRLLQEVGDLNNPTPATESVDGLFFADILVRGIPVFQIGGLPELNATQRADIINLPTEIYGIEFSNAPTDIGVMSTNAKVALRKRSNNYNG